MNSAQAMKSIGEVFALYEKYGQADYIGEPVSQLEHMTQAADLTMQEGYEDDVVLAAFFHDIGHLCESHLPLIQMGSEWVSDHETIGAQFYCKKDFQKRSATLFKVMCLQKNT